MKTNFKENTLLTLENYLVINIIRVSKNLLIRQLLQIYMSIILINRPTVLVMITLLGLT